MVQEHGYKTKLINNNGRAGIKKTVYSNLFLSQLFIWVLPEQQDINTINSTSQVPIEGKSPVCVMYEIICREGINSRCRPF